MRSSSRLHQLCYWALALLLVTVRSADAHVHMCLDGQESPAALHVADGGVHHAGGANAEQGHNDKDVKYAVDGTLKKADSGDAWVIATVWSLAFLLPPRTAELPSDREASPPACNPFFLRPPLRGPPR